MENLKMIERHAMKFDLLSTHQQQRIMRKMASRARAYSKEKQNNAESTEARHYDWQANVRLARQSRAIHLIRAFLKGTPYQKVEVANNFHTLSPLHVVNDYSPAGYSVFFESFIPQFADWLKPAQA